MGLDHLGVLGLGEDLEQVAVRQEVEAGEARALGLEVVAQALLDHVEELVGFFELDAQPAVVAERYGFLPAAF